MSPVRRVNTARNLVESCVVICICQCPNSCFSILHNGHVDGLSFETLHIDEEDIFPRYWSSKYLGTWVVSVPDVCDDHRKYQSTTVPGTATSWNRAVIPILLDTPTKMFHWKFDIVNCTLYILYNSSTCINYYTLQFLSLFLRCISKFPWRIW